MVLGKVRCGLLVGSLVRGPSLLEVLVAERPQLSTSLGCPWPLSHCHPGQPQWGGAGGCLVSGEEALGLNSE